MDKGFCNASEVSLDILIPSNLLASAFPISVIMAQHSCGPCIWDTVAGNASGSSTDQGEKGQPARTGVIGHPISLVYLDLHLLREKFISKIFCNRLDMPSSCRHSKF